VDGITIRDRGLRLRQIGAGLTRRFHASQAGTTRPALTLEDGSLVVTDNYLKVRIPPGLPRNQRVMVQIRAEGGRLEGTPCAPEPGRTQQNPVEPSRTP